MTAPTFVGASTGLTDATGAWSFAGRAAGATGRIIIMQILQDGSTSGAVALTSATTFRRALDGTSDTMTFLGTFDVGSPASALMHIWIGRSNTVTGLNYVGTNSTSEDLYFRDYEFLNGSAGTTLSTVIENGTAGGTASTASSATQTVSDADVTTLGPDRLALQLVGVNDDLAINAFVSETGGDWGVAATYAEASGTDGAIGLETAAMASAGTIGGGTFTLSASAAWGVVGFALIGTTVAAKAPPPRRRPCHLCRR